MANGVCKFIYQNLIPGASAITSTGQAPGIITAAIKTGTGSASLTPSGVYTGSRDQEFLVQIDSTASGVEVGQANYSWAGYASTGDPSAWDATGVVTHSGTGALSDGVKISFTSAAGNDFALGDKWQFKGLAPFGINKMLDWDRNSYHRTATVSTEEVIWIDMGSTTYAASHLFIPESNITTAATVVVYAVGNTDATALATADSLTYTQSSKGIYSLLVLQLFGNHRYIKLSIQDPSNPDGYIRIGELIYAAPWGFTGNYDVNSMGKYSYIQNSQTTPSGIKNTRGYNKTESWTVHFSYLPATEFDNFQTMMDAILDKETGRKRPFIWSRDFQLTGSVSSNVKMVECDGYSYTQHPGDRYSLDLTLTEVVKND